MNYAINGYDWPSFHHVGDIDMAYDVPDPVTRPSSLPSSPESAIPPSSSLLQNLATQTTLLNQIFVALSSSHQQSQQQQQQTPLPLLYQLINQANTDLLYLRKGVREHQEIWARVERKKHEVIELERKTRGILRTIERERSELESMIREAREVVGSVDKVESNPIDIPSLLSHAHGVARHSSAPISSLLTPIDKAQYQPWPTENAMRQGLLFQMEGSMSSVGQTGQIGDAVAAQEDVVMQEPQEVPQVHREEHGRRYDPEAVFTLDLNSDSDDE